MKRCLNPLFQRTVFLLPPLLWGYLRPEVRIHKIINSVDYHRFRSSLASRVHPSYCVQIPRKCIESRHFSSCPHLSSQNRPPSSPHQTLCWGKLLISPGSIFLKIVSQKRRKGWRKLWFDLLVFNQKTWRWLGLLGYMYFLWFVTFLNVVKINFVNNIYHIV